MRSCVALVVVAALWSLGWFAAAQGVRRGFQDWLGHEAANHRAWTCPDQQVAGFPLALQLTCERPTFRGEIAGHVTSGVIEGLTAEVALAHPGAIAVTLRGPFNLRAEDDSFEFEASWSGLTVGVPVPIGDESGDRSVAAQRLAVSLAAPGQGVFNLRAAQLTGTAAPIEAARDAQFAFTAEGVSFPTLDPLPGLEAPADASGAGVLRQAALLTAPTVERLEAWRQAGGDLQLARLSIRKGPFVGSAAGTLALDASHRPKGRLDTTLAGFGPIAARFGIPLEGIEIGGMLTSLLGGGKAPPGPKDGVQLPVILADGHLAVGPFPTAVRLTPLY